MIQNLNCVKSKEILDWGIIYNYKGLDFEFCLYIYNDDPNTIYLANVKVKRALRQQGIGNRILIAAENEAKSFNCKYIQLRVFKDSWVRDWYHRHGYNVIHIEDGSNYIWMEKEILK